MKAIVCTRLGLPRLARYKDVPEPVPGDREVLIEVHASSVTFSNLFLFQRRWWPFRLLLGGQLIPKSGIPGTDVAGRVAALGPGVTRFKTGDAVYGDLYAAGKGALAEYVCAPENVPAPMPANLSFEEAAAVPESALVALRGLRDKGQVQKGQRVLVYGASGGIGTFAVQIAKHLGAEVTGVCGPRNVDLVRSVGADHVIDYTKEDFTRSGQLYDLVFAARYTRPVSDIGRALSPGGVYVSTMGPSAARGFQEFYFGPRALKKRGQRVSVIDVDYDWGDLVLIKDLIEAGKLRPVVDRRYPLSRAPEAFRYYGGGHARGKVVITVRPDG